MGNGVMGNGCRYHPPSLPYQLLFNRYRQILAVRFQAVPDELTAQITKLTKLEQLKGLLRHAAVVGSIEEFEQLLETNP